jgi:endo-1,4-beta-xylanase
MSFKITLATFLMTGLAANAQTPAALKDVFKGYFHVGAALNQAQFEERDARGVAIVRAQFDTISPENVLKWESVHPRPDGYAFDAADRYVAFGEKHHMFIVGHTLVWHSQVPQWVFQDDKGAPLDRDGLLKRMHDHIQTVVGRYKGRIGGWDVVNEALNEDGALRPGVSTFSTRVCALMPSSSRRASFVRARFEAPLGALENSPGRKPCGTGPETRQPRRGVRRPFVPGDG